MDETGRDRRLGRDERYMVHALELARSGLGRTSPNPMVGCVIVREGRIVGEGYHEAAGLPHAEIRALEAAGPRATRATVYVTMEPCCTHGRTPPCTDALIGAGVARVVAAMPDPNPRVSGKGFGQLKNAGVDVECGILEQTAAKLNEAYAKWITTGVPFVTAKWAMSVDGRIAAHRGSRTHLTGDEANKKVHAMRAESDAIMVGVGTVLADDPQLTVRMVAMDERARHPARVVVDSRGRTPVGSRLALTAREVPTLVFVTCEAEGSRLDRLRDAGVEVVQVGASIGRVDVASVLAELGRREICSILLEGGALLAGSVAVASAIDKVVAFISPRILASSEGPAALDVPKGTPSLQMDRLNDVQVEVLGQDVMIAGYPAREEGEQQCLPV